VGQSRKRIQQISHEVRQVQQGSLYPALHRLEQQGWIRAKWAESETGTAGEVLCADGGGAEASGGGETANWNRLSAAIDLVIAGA